MFFLSPTDVTFCFISQSEIPVPLAISRSKWRMHPCLEEMSLGFPTSQKGTGVLKPLISTSMRIYGPGSYHFIVLLNVIETSGTLEWRTESTVKVVENLTLCHKCYSLANANYTIMMTLWQSNFPQNVRNTHFVIDCLFLIQVKAQVRRKTLWSQCIPLAGPPGKMAHRVLHGWGDVYAPPYTDGYLWLW